jgi:hypothetical protein
MSWNEAYAVWSAIQVAETRKKDYLVASAAQQERQQQETQIRSIRNLAQAMWNSLARGLPPGLVAIVPAAAAALRNGIDWLSNAPQAFSIFIQARLGQGVQPFIDISDKLAAIFGDFQKRLEDMMHHNDQILKSLLAQFQWQERLGQVQSLISRLLGQFGPRQIFRGIERRVKSVFQKILGLFGHSQEPDEEETADTLRGS